MRMFHRIWAKKGGLELKALDRFTFLFSFEEMEDMHLALRRTP